MTGSMKEGKRENTTHPLQEYHLPWCKTMSKMVKSAGYFDHHLKKNFKEIEKKNCTRTTQFTSFGDLASVSSPFQLGELSIAYFPVSLLCHGTA